MARRNNVILEPEAIAGTEMPSCRHYWIIDSPQGPTSRGVCKFCGAVKEFYNSWSASGGAWSRSSPDSQRTKPADIEPPDSAEPEATEPDTDTDFDIVREN